MGNLDLASILKALRGERAQIQSELANLDKAIAVLGELSVTTLTPDGALRNEPSPLLPVERSPRLRSCGGRR